jgi:hypothetical protein
MGMVPISKQEPSVLHLTRGLKDPLLTRSWVSSYWPAGWHPALTRGLVFLLWPGSWFPVSDPDPTSSVLIIPHQTQYDFDLGYVIVWWSFDFLVWVWFMVFNATFNNISVISWQSVLMLEETGVPGENHQPVASHWQILSHNIVSSTPRHERGSNSQR